MSQFLNLAGDAPDIEPTNFAERLLATVKAARPSIDDYSRGGAVAAFETRIAAVLGKERAMMVATGTLANLLALKTKVGARGRRVVVQAEGHIANDSGDCAAEVGGLSLLAIPHHTYTASEIAAEIARAETARVAVKISTIVVESPARRAFGAMVPFAEQRSICAIARENGIASHLDGARIYIAAGYLDCSVRDLAAPYDTVYVSLYKYFGVPFGAVLAGPAALIDDMYHERRRLGGGLQQMWPVAVMADAVLDELAGTWRKIAVHAEAVATGIAATGVSIERTPNGTNVYRLGVENGAEIAERAGAAGLKMPPAMDGMIPIKANATWLTTPVDEIVARLLAVLRG